jgi:hypothetical protein
MPDLVYPVVQERASFLKDPALLIPTLKVGLQLMVQLFQGLVYRILTTLETRLFRWGQLPGSGVE